jgi:hypothetical protein
MPSEAIAGRNVISRPAPESDLQIEVIAFPPIFLVGDQRPRQRLAMLLDGRDGIACTPESSLLTDLAGVAQRNWPRLCRYGYPEEYWRARVAGFFSLVQKEYATSRHLTRWAAGVDSDALGLVDRLFPRCRVIRLIRGNTRALSARYYQLSAVELFARPQEVTAGVLSFLDPLVEVPARP